jgi:hypothetical protein
MNDTWAAIRAHSNSAPKSLSCTFGELTAYDPATHTAKFQLPMFPDNSGTPIETGWVQLATLQNGPGYGAQFVPPQGGQAIIFFMDHGNILPVGALFLFNDIEHPPFTDGKTNGYIDQHGSGHTTTDDGKTPGDGAGAARTIGKKFTSIGTSGGHATTQDDIAGQVKVATAGGHYDLYDDTGRVISRVTAGGLQTIHDDAKAEIAHLAANVGLGDRVANLDATHAALNKSHLQTYETNLQAGKLQDYIKFANLLNAAGTITGPQLVTILAALVAGWTNGNTLPSGSSIVKVK